MDRKNAADMAIMKKIIVISITITMDRKDVADMTIMKKIIVISITITITMDRKDAVDMTIMDIITMQMRYLQAGERRLPTNIQRRNLIIL